MVSARLRSSGRGRARSHRGLTTDWIRMRIFKEIDVTTQKQRLGKRQEFYICDIFRILSILPLSCVLLDFMQVHTNVICMFPGGYFDFQIIFECAK